MATLPTWRDEAPLNLAFDADDTLWDSNIHFLEAFEAYLDAIAALGVDTHRDSVKAEVREAELQIIQTHGYGRRPYVLALERAIIQLAPELHHQPLRQEVEKIGAQLIGRHCELLPGVEETVSELARRHRLILVTKGQRDEQLLKLERSGLAPYFSRIETPREKNPDSYRRMLVELGLERERTFMIGNSPRSDINPALHAGLRAAVYIRHPHTWELEDEALDASDRRIIVLATFRDLLRVF